MEEEAAASIPLIELPALAIINFADFYRSINVETFESSFLQVRTLFLSMVAGLQQ